LWGIVHLARIDRPIRSVFGHEGGRSIAKVHLCELVERGYAMKWALASQFRINKTRIVDELTA